MTDRPRYRLVIEPVPVPPGRAGTIIRLRKMLKELRRRWGFKCVDIREVKDGKPLAP